MAAQPQLGLRAQRWPRGSGRDHHRADCPGTPVRPVARIAARAALCAAPYAVLLALAVTVAPASSQIRIGIGMPRLDVGIGYDVPAYPDLRLVPGYPVYYAPGLDANYFFYDGMFWIFQGENWYSSAWYNGPWQGVDPDAVPDYLLRVPVGYYVRPPRFFGLWQRDAPPRWGEHWGAAWTQQRGNWDRWDRRFVPAAAAPPVYQRQYTGARYPRADEQVVLRRQQDHYQPQDPAVRRVLEAQQRAPDRRRAPSSGAAPQQWPAREAGHTAPPQQRPQETAHVPPQQQRPQEAAHAPAQQQRPQETAHAREAQQRPQEPASAPAPQQRPQEAARAPTQQQRPQEESSAPPPQQRPAGPGAAPGREAEGRGDERR